MADKLTMPGMVHLGCGAFRAAEDDICSLGGKALIVTGKSMIRQGHVEMLTHMLSAHLINWEIFSGISDEPTDEMVDTGVSVYREKHCDFIIGFGGGSPMDAAKGIRVKAKENSMGHTPLLAAIPSTAGTGSEVTQFAIITNTEKNIKMLLAGPEMMPDVAVIDPIFSLQAPAHVTAASGLDALTHAIEAYTSKKAYDQSDRYAVSAITRIFKYLPPLMQDGSNRECRKQMAAAAFEAGVSFNNSSVTLVHGMSRPIGALFHVSHGLSNAMLLKTCLEYAVEGAYDRFGELGRQIGAADPAADDKDASGGFLNAVANLCRVCEVPTLKQYGIEKKEFYGLIDKMALDAMASGSPSNTRRTIDLKTIKMLYRRLWEENDV